MATSLQSAVKSALKNWRRTSPGRLIYEPSGLKSAFLWAGRRPVLAAFALLALYALAAALIARCAPPYINSTFVFGPPDPEKFAGADAIFSLVATQTSIAGAVYAVVFAFTTIFLGRQTATKASVQTYLVSSGAKFAGTSSIMAAIALTLTAPFLAAADGWVQFGWVVVGGCWVSFNGLLTVYFLIQTFSFGTPEGRRRARDNYAVSIAWPREWCRHAASVLACSPVRYKLLEADDLVNDFRGSGPAFATSELLAAAESGVRYSQRGRKQVTNIRYGWLQSAYTSWHRRAVEDQKRVSAAAKKASRPVFMALALPDPAHVTPGDYLAAVSGGTPFNQWEQFCIWAAFSFSRPGIYDDDVSVMDCLAEVQAAIAAAIEAGAEREFFTELEFLLKLLVDLLRASAYVEDEKLDSHALTSNRSNAFGRSVAEEWNSVLDDCVKLALRKLEQDEVFSAGLIATPHRIVRRAQPHLSIALKRHYQQVQRRFLVRAIDWASDSLTRLKVSRGLSPSDDTIRLLPEPTASRYRRVISSGLGAWEAFAAEHLEQARTSSVEEIGEVILSHIVGTAATVTPAVISGDHWTVRALTGTLLRWGGRIESAFRGPESYVLRSWTTTIQPLLSASQGDQAVAPPGQVGAESALSEQAVLVAALDNFWRDVCAVMPATLVKETPLDNPAIVDRTAVAVRGVLRPEKERFEGDFVEPPFSGPSDYLLSFVRQHVIDGRYREGYRAQMDKVVAECAYEDLQERIPGRIYNVISPDSLEDVAVGQVFCLTVLSDHPWEADKAALDAVLELWGEEDEKRRELREELDRLVRFVAVVREHYRELWTRSTGKPEEEFVLAVRHAEQGIGSAIKLLDEARDKAAEKAVLDQGQITSLEVSIGEFAPEEDTEFPLFRRAVHLVDELPDERRSSVTIQGYPWLRFTNPQLSAPTSNETEVLQRYVASKLRGDVIRDVLRQFSIEQRGVSSSSDLTSAISNYLETLAPERQAVLLVPSAIEPSWLIELRRAGWAGAGAGDEQRLDALVRIAGFGNESNYLGHLRGAAVYTGPVPSGSAYLLPYDVIKAVRLKKTPARFIELSVAPSEKGVHQCTLEMAWFVEVEVGEGPIWLLRYPYSRRRQQNRR